MSMAKIGYRTAAARALSGRAFNTAGAAVGQSALAQQAARAASSTAAAVGRFATRGNIANLAASVVAGWALNEILKGMADAQGGPTHVGFIFVNTCRPAPPEGRDNQDPGNPSLCAQLLTYLHGLYDDYTILEKLYGFREISRMPTFPSWETRNNFDSNSSVGVRPVVYPNGYFNRPLMPMNTFPADVSVNSDGDIVLRGAAGVIPKSEAVPPEMDPEARPVASYPSHPLILPTKLLWARRAFDASQPAGQRSETGPAPGIPRPWDTVKRPGWEGYAPTVPVPEKAIEIDSTGKATNLPATRALLKAGANTHERKVRTPFQKSTAGHVASILKKGFGQFTEASDMIDAVFWALPEKLRIELWAQNGHHKLGTQKQLEALYDHYREIDPVQAAYNLAFQQMQDDVIGMASSGIVEATGGSPLAMTISRYTKALKASKEGYQ